MKSILFVDDDALVRSTLKRLLEDERGWRSNFASSGEDALDLVRAFSYDGIITDFMMPGMTGIELLETIRREPRTADIPVIMLTGAADRDLKRRALDAGATDLLAKPVDHEDLIARIRSILRLKDHQDALKSQNLNLETMVKDRTAQLEHARTELVWRLGKAAEFRDEETGHHVVRVGHFALELSRALGLPREFAVRLFHTSPLHDIGKLGIPDNILLKPGRLDTREWAVMKQHTTIGAAILRSRCMEYGRASRFAVESIIGTLPLAGENPLVEVGANIAHYHHERWDGRGYPMGLKGEEIPIEARITALADVYDALSSRRPYKEPYPEEKVLAVIRNGAGTQFDPQLIPVFERCLPTFREIREEFVDDFEDLATAVVDEPADLAPHA